MMKNEQIKSSTFLLFGWFVGLMTHAWDKQFVMPKAKTIKWMVVGPLLDGIWGCSFMYVLSSMWMNGEGNERESHEQHNNRWTSRWFWASADINKKQIKNLRDCFAHQKQKKKVFCLIKFGEGKCLVVAAGRESFFLTVDCESWSNAGGSNGESQNQQYYSNIFGMNLEWNWT